MIKVLGILVVTLLIVWKEIPPLFQEKKKKDIWIFSIFQLSASTLLSLIVLDVKNTFPFRVDSNNLSTS